MYRLRDLSLLLILFTVSACASYRPVTRHPSSPSYKQDGVASWYGPGFQGRKTANGERFDPNALTCAHRTLPFGTVVRVTNLENNKMVTVRVNDRGPFRESRLIDLSLEAARVLNFVKQGMTHVHVEWVPSL